jgi:NAD(P)-dependent dehydrogenase (short-subunit alcohol dehydrogenase family)
VGRGSPHGRAAQAGGLVGGTCRLRVLRARRDKHVPPQQALIEEVQDIANAVVFLAAPESNWITARLLVVGCGRMDCIGHA